MTNDLRILEVKYQISKAVMQIQKMERDGDTSDAALLSLWRHLDKAQQGARSENHDELAGKS